MKPKTYYRKPQSTDAKAITASARAILETVGWAVVDFQHHDRMPKGALGWPDLVAIRRSVVWFIEIKAPGDRLRSTQVSFYRRIHPHLGATLRYMIAESVEDIEKIVTGEASIMEIPEKYRYIILSDWREEVDE